MNAADMDHGFIGACCLINRLREEILIDANDLDIVSSSKWWGAGMRYRYAYASIGGKLVPLHRFLTACPSGMVVDHVSGNTLDNRRLNLRVCSYAENAYNRKPKLCSEHGLKGVHLQKGRKRFAAAIISNGEKHFLGGFATKDEAHAAYCEAAARLHGEFARTE